MIGPPGCRTLSDRQKQIIALAATGLTNAEIGRRIWVSEDTVKTHLRRAYVYLEVQNRAQAVAVGMREGWVQ